MLNVLNSSTNGHFNLALEEVLFKNFEEEIFMLWRNDASIVLGKHQNAMAEINTEYVEKAKIPVIRRLSGGGTVYHDLGNVNFTFMLNRESDRLIDFKAYMTPIYNCLINMGLEVEFSERNDLFLHGKKVSGNAEHAFKNRVLHHGTLLFNARTENLKQALKVKTGVFEDKAVQSVRSEVSNLLPHLNPPMTIEAFMEYIQRGIKRDFPNMKDFKLDNATIQKTERLAEEKYRTWDWNFGYSPKYWFRKTIKDVDDKIEIGFYVQKGIIEQCEIKGWSNEHESRLVSKAMLGLKHRRSDIFDAFESLKSNSTTISKLIARIQHHILP